MTDFFFYVTRHANCLEAGPRGKFSGPIPWDGRRVKPHATEMQLVVVALAAVQGSGFQVRLKTKLAGGGVGEVHWEVGKNDMRAHNSLKIEHGMMDA